MTTSHTDPRPVVVVFAFDGHRDAYFADTTPEEAVGLMIALDEVGAQQSFVTFADDPLLDRLVWIQDLPIDD